MEVPAAWTPEDARAAYRVLDHPADLWLEVRGADLPELLEHGLLALYDNLAGQGTARPVEEREFRVEEPTAADALRRLLAEALYVFEREGFVGAGARVSVSGGGTSPGSLPVSVEALVWGEAVGRERHAFLTEVKAVTYHGLTATCTADGTWLATVLLDL